MNGIDGESAPLIDTFKTLSNGTIRDGELLRMSDKNLGGILDL